MSRPKIIKKLQQQNQALNYSDVESIFETFSNDIVHALKEGKKIELRGLGTFFVKKIKEKKSARNPKTGELIYVPEKNKVRFRPSKKLEKFINK